MSVKRNGSKGATRGRNVNPENAKRKALYSQPSWKISRSKK